MNFRRLLIVAVVVSMASFASSKQANAQVGAGCFNGGGFYGGLGFGGFGNFRHPYRWARVPAPPYFALHPPVYYGQQYSRPYGVSPFACRNCQVQPNKDYRPTKAKVAPLAITNPFVKPKKAKPGQKTKQTKLAGSRYTPPQVIYNPYVQQVEVAKK